MSQAEFNRGFVDEALKVRCPHCGSTNCWWDPINERGRCQTCTCRYTLQDLYGEDVYPTDEAQPTPKGKQTMNKSLSVFLLSNDARLIACAYELTPDGKPEAGKLCHYKTFDKTIGVGDLVIIPTGTRVGFTAVKVFAVDVEVDMAMFENTTDYKWIAGKFSSDEYTAALAAEKRVLDQIDAAEKAKKREELRKTLLEFVPEGTSLLIEAPEKAPHHDTYIVEDEVKPLKPRYNDQPKSDDDDIPF